MKREGIEWFDQLVKDSLDFRSKKPLPARETLSPAEEMQCRIIGGSFISWLEHQGPRLLQEREVLSKLQEWEKDPFIVFTSDKPGLIAAREILDGNSDRFAFLFPKEFKKWEACHSDNEYQWHIHTWSFFTTLDKASLKRTSEYPLAPGETFWLHQEGTMCGQLFGRGGDHLWKWDGENFVLLQEGFNQWVS